MPTRINRTCLYCQKTFSIGWKEISQGYGRYCSKKCRLAGMYIKAKCETCKKAFYYLKSEQRSGHRAGRFCSADCFPKSPSATCDYCGEKFFLSSCYLKRDRDNRFCSSSCYHNFRRSRRQRFAKEACVECGESRGVKGLYALGLCRNCYHRKRNKQLKLEIIKAYGGKCACCGDKHFEFLCLDHVNGDGRNQRLAHFEKHGHILAGASLYAQVKKAGFPSTYRLLCVNCNFALGIYKYCPHQKT